MKYLSRSILITCLTACSCFLSTELSAQETFKQVAGDIDLDVTLVQGISVVDYNGDGYDDIFITRRSRANQLFKNQGDGTFVDVARETGLDFIGKSHQSIWADYDADGDMDCYLTVNGQPHKLYENRGNDNFVDVSTQVGVSITGLPAAAIWGDVNGDNLLDLFVFNINADDVCLLNDGDGTFTDYTASSGIAQNRLSMGATFIDFDRDGDLDLYLSHDGNAGNFMYENDGEGNFTDVSEALDIYTESEGMGVAVGDFNNDGWPDLFLTNRLENFLFKNNGGESFTEIAAEAGVDDDGLGWGVSWLDFDNDGLLDLYVANDSYYSDHPNLLYRNRGDETFEIIDQETAIASEQGTYGTTIADLDQNGFPELLIANRGNDDWAEIFVNQVENDNEWLVFTLKREDTGLPVIGAEIQVTTDQATHTRYLFAGTSWEADDSKQMLFGLGEAERIVKVAVSWPDGSTTEYEQIDFKKRYELSDGGEARLMDYQVTPLRSSEEPDPGSGVITSIEPDQPKQTLRLFPNPGNGNVHLSFDLEARQVVKVDLISQEGSRISKLYHETLAPGNHQLNLQLRNSSARIYLLRIRLGEDVFVRKVIRQ